MNLLRKHVILHLSWAALQGFICFFIFCHFHLQFLSLKNLSLSLSIAISERPTEAEGRAANQQRHSSEHLYMFIVEMGFHWIFTGMFIWLHGMYLVHFEKICSTFCKRNSLNVHKCKHKQKTNIRQHNATLGQCRTERETNAQKAK